MRSTTAGSVGPRPSSLMLDTMLPGTTLNSTKITSTTASTVGTVCRIRRIANESIGIVPPSLHHFLRWREGESASLGGRGLVDPEVFDVLMGQFRRVQLNPLEPRLHRHDSLVVVEEPHRRFVIEQGIGLLQQLAALGGVVGLPGLVDQLVEVRVLEGRIVAG